MSAQEKQLISICRAILRKNKVVIIEESTNLGVATEQSIRKLFDQEFKGSTVITIAHRVATIAKSDRVLVLDAGEVAEYDTPQQLLKNEQSLLSELLREAREKQRSTI